MNLKKKLLALGLALSLTVALAACGAKEEPPAPEEAVKQEDPAAPVEEIPAEEAPADTGVTMRIAAMTGPTGMGLARLMKEAEGGEDYAFTLAGTADEISPLLI